MRNPDRLVNRKPRLDSPLVREGDSLVPVSWEVAIDRVAEGFNAVGPGSGGFGMFSCSKSSNEMNYAAQKFSRVVLASNNIDSCNRT